MLRYCCIIIIIIITIIIIIVIITSIIILNICIASISLKKKFTHSPYKVSVVKVRELHVVTEHHVWQQVFQPRHVLGERRVRLNDDLCGCFRTIEYAEPPIRMTDVKSKSL